MTAKEFEIQHALGTLKIVWRTDNIEPRTSVLKCEKWCLKDLVINGEVYMIPKDSPLHTFALFLYNPNEFNRLKEMLINEGILT